MILSRNCHIRAAIQHIASTRKEKTKVALVVFSVSELVDKRTAVLGHVATATAGDIWQLIVMPQPTTK